jgi:hypothetical protein
MLLSIKDFIKYPILYDEVDLADALKLLLDFVITIEGLLK